MRNSFAFARIPYHTYGRRDTDPIILEMYRIELLVRLCVLFSPQPFLGSDRMRTGIILRRHLRHQRRNRTVPMRNVRRALPTTTVILMVISMIQVVMPEYRSLCRLWRGVAHNRTLRPCINNDFVWWCLWRCVSLCAFVRRAFSVRANWIPARHYSCANVWYANTLIYSNIALLGIDLVSRFRYRIQSM